MSSGASSTSGRTRRYHTRVMGGARILSISSALCALALLAACTKAPPRSSTPPQAPPAVASGRTAVPAPIETAELVVREQQSGRYAVRIRSGLPSGCAKFERIDVARDGYVVNVSVWNTIPSDATVACTMIYGIAENTAELGGDFVRGEAYALHVNGEPKLSFTPN
jgi:hypothetical protein